MTAKLTHLDEKGAAHMVDVGQKPDTNRLAVAGASVHMRPETLALILSGQAPKGDVLAVARLAGIMAAKKTADLIPLCHPLSLTQASLELTLDLEKGRIDLEATAATNGPTGVEMEALTAVSVAALTIYDMLKAVDRGMTITGIRLLKKDGGRSGLYERQE